MSSGKSSSWAHPRSRGEHHSQLNATGGKKGSSPLTRGAQIPATNSAPRLRLIPAHAGSTCGQPLPSRPRRAHPRSRGEHGFLEPGHPRVGGSSPLTRGAPARIQARHPCGGLIPAHAGSTVVARLWMPTRWAHPRSRGEHRTDGHGHSFSMGSSPLTRGALAYGLGAAVLPGLIPAHAGSTGIRPRRRSATRAHPRSRGEHLCGLTRCGRCVGLIPAHAGSTLRMVGPSYRSFGSSPLTRGAQEDRQFPGG